MVGNNLSQGYGFQFTTSRGESIINDTVPPQVANTSPENNAVNVSRAAVLSVVFNEKISASSVTSSTFVVSNETESIAGTISCSDNYVIFTPSNPLDYSHQYRVLITTGVKDIAGNPLQSNYTIIFTSDSPQPEIQVLHGTTNIVNNTGTVSYGNLYVGNSSDTTITIKNTGVADLILNGSQV
jgi:hypothetical protein